eukprot:TRINITY_DN4863_c0_g1_i2.p1 TRINITY_DN4863_c0_g1~~TRINITY_DN4863_c0_g1_i2.p1  ORF type:complete len:219 (-),score=18.16 TRINITY_DN4863_c0_g1_i2:198-854(-)
MYICLYLIDSEDIVIISACNYQIAISLSILIYATVAACSEFLNNHTLFHCTFCIYASWLCSMCIIRYFQIPGDISDKYYKTIFYMKLLMILELLTLIAFAMLAAIFLFYFAVGLYREFSPSVIELYSLIVAAVKPVMVENIPTAKYDPRIHASKKECIICMEEFTAGVEIAELPCDERHYFHASCVMDWMKEAKVFICPICRKEVAKELNKKQREKKS